MKKKFWIRTVTAVMLLALALPISAFADAETSREPVSAGGNDYQMWSCLYSGRTFRGSTWVSKPDLVNVPASYMGVSTGLYHSNTGNAYVVKDMTFNSEAAYFHYNTITKGIVPDSDGVSCTGQVSLYTGTRYMTVDAPRTVVEYASRAAKTEEDVALLAALDENGEYPRTASGKTYGSQLLAEYVGHGPELIAADGIDGTSGYILADDLNPHVNTPEEAAAYMERMAKNTKGYREIPLYDLEENVIGTFRVYTGISEEVPPEVQATIDGLEQQKAAKLAAEN